ncbi:hypothetical protein [Streptomyces sp. NBC_00344]|uniref:hypothetical protein n=1 Tax=Streptomyces sp. NBC_00344 TaxID=2975720 RepID=UPI002E1A5E16
MTQNGQGDEPQHPAVRRAHEGVVMPSDGSGPYVPEVAGEHTVPAGGQPWGQPWGPQDSQQQPPQHRAPQLQPPQHQAPQLQAPQHQGPYQPQDPYPSQSSYQQPAQSPSYAQPLPPEAVPGAGDSDATQYIAPVALPPENPAESTQFLGYRQQSAQPPAPAGSEADPTQFLPPVPAAPASAPYGIRPGAPEDRQPPAEFDSLFRSDRSADPQAAGETQQLPRFEQQQQPGGGPYGQQQYQQPPQARQYAPQPQPPSRAAAGEGRRKSSRTPLIAAVVVGCAVIGLGAGALLSGGGSDKKDDKQPVASTSTAASQAPDQAAQDPAKPQAVSLDKLLGDSNDSRSAVVAAVGSIRACQNLPQAAAALRGAAKQRHSLVTRLGALTVDKLPDNAQLTSSLTKAWNASATADEQYAAWAHRVAANGKKGCKHGHAQRTAEAGRGDQASGEATAAKKQASGLWNAIAGKYGLTARRGDQL